MNDKGFTHGIREIVGDMLKLHPSDRPSMVKLVSRIDDEWCRWRAQTKEGQAFVDVTDKSILNRACGIGNGFLM